MNGLVTQWIRPEIQALSAYHVADASGLIKLDAMENPHVWPQELRRQWAEELSEVAVNRYPDPHAQELTQAIRRHIGLPDEQQLLLGNGSDEIIQMIALALSGSDRTVLSVEPGFVMYRMIATFCGMDYVGVPLRKEDFSLHMPALRQAIERHRPAVIFLAYPNNPTGNLFSAQEVREIISLAPGLVVVDEAYAPFTDHSFLPELGRHNNLLVMRTFSKWGLAGLRLGYLAGPGEWLEQFDKVRMPYNINVLTQKSALFALRNEKVFEEQTRNIRQQRALMFDALHNLPGLTVFPSEANFLLVSTPPGRSEALFQGLLHEGVLVKKLHGADPLLEDCIRITIGTTEENQQLLAVLTRLLS